MKKYILVLLISFCCARVSGQFHYILNIKTSTIGKTKVYFNIKDNNNFKAIKRDSFIIVNNNAQLKGELNQPSNFANFFIWQGRKFRSIDFVIDAGETNINLEFSEDNDRKLKIKNLNTRSNDISFEMQNIRDKYSQIYQRVSNDTSKIFALPKDMSQKCNLEMIKLLQSYPDEYFSLVALNWLGHLKSGVEYAETILATLATFNPKLKNSTLGKEIYNEKTTIISNINSAKISNNVIEFSVRDNNGRVFSNNMLRGQNYIIVFSATWCIPCQHQLPKLKKIYSEYKNKGLKLIYFNEDDDVEKWKQHILNNKLEWINVSERVKANKSNISNLFGVEALPTCFIVDKAGKITYNSDQSDTDLSEIETYVKRLFEN